LIQRSYLEGIRLLCNSFGADGLDEVAHTEQAFMGQFDLLVVSWATNGKIQHFGRGEFEHLKTSDYD
jgi:hypothetical protein